MTSIVGMKDENKGRGVQKAKVVFFFFFGGRGGVHLGILVQFVKFALKNYDYF